MERHIPYRTDLLSLKKRRIRVVKAVVPLATLWQKLDALTSAVLSREGQSGGKLTVVLQLDGKTVGQAVVDYINGQTIIFGNNPINI